MSMLLIVLKRMIPPCVVPWQKSEVCFPKLQPWKHWFFVWKRPSIHKVSWNSLSTNVRQWQRRFQSKIILLVESQSTRGQRSLLMSIFSACRSHAMYLTEIIIVDYLPFRTYILFIQISPSDELLQFSYWKLRERDLWNIDPVNDLHYTSLRHLKCCRIRWNRQNTSFCRPSA